MDDSTSQQQKHVPTGHTSTPLTPIQREARKQAKRDVKLIKKASRAKQKIENKIRFDHRPEVRMAAKLKLELDKKKAGVGTDTTAGTAGTAGAATESEDTTITATATAVEDQVVVSLIDRSLSEFSLSLVSQYPPSSILELDVSHNNLSDLPGLEALTNLQTLNIRRNDFRSLPSSLAHLVQLTTLNASRNQLRPSAELLLLLSTPPLSHSLQSLDLTFNKKIYTQEILDLLTTALPETALHMTVTFPPPVGAYVGDAPGRRDANLLRSQLEPFTTLQLRHRLMETFGHAPYSMYGEAPASRALVMSSLLKEYEKTVGLGKQRKLVRCLGTPVPPAALALVRHELQLWSDRFDDEFEANAANNTANTNTSSSSFVMQERPMIHASKYMILRSPTEAEEKIARLNSRRASIAMRKYQVHGTLWQAAKAAVATVDPDFASVFTGLAVTKGFRGSPHIDTTNIGPFYGLSVGDFDDGTGGIRVELDPFTVCDVNTKNRLGRIDGRFPHWVAPYDTTSTTTRYSLIFYLTEGVVQPKTTAVFGDIIVDDANTK